MIGHRSSSMKEGWDCDYDYQSIILRGYMYKYTCFSFHTKINKQKPWKGINWIQCGKILLYFARRVWRYQRGYQNPYIEKENVQKDKQRFTKHTHKTKDRVTRTPLKTGGEHRCSGRVGSSYCTSDTRRVNLVTNPVISHEWGKVFTTSITYPWSFVTQIFHIYSSNPLSRKYW